MERPCFADLGDITLFYTDHGEGGTPLLLVHGWGADSQEWVWHLPALSADRRVIAVDLRGHGYSTAPESGNNPRRMAGDLVRLCALLDIPRVVAVGHSMGAVIVSLLAAEHPELVEAVVTVEPGYGYTGFVAENMPGMIQALRKGDTGAIAVQIDEWSYGAASPDWLRLWHARRLRATPPHVLIEAFEALFGGDEPIGLRPHSDELLRRRACPVLTFWFDPAQADWERSLFKHPQSRAVVWEGSGHRLHEERPAEFVSVVTRWLKTLGRAPRS
ncbi:alpha/beta hydrolase [Bailinhaonella thermotolerans]|uniref:Alpha/beta hydrolase n=1 Tax=Bailinhaonella thermotolerans TaxID=1070861 RepID=A0A3A4A136_9ACTN|nr:alpha/beta hydrolase [Bailinhaonella thermotolerans]